MNPYKALPNMTTWIVMNRKNLIVAACISIASLSFSVHAQSTTGGISGEAKTGDTLYLTNPDTGFKREMKISKDGKYQLQNLQAGTYQLVPMHADGSFGPPQQLFVTAGRTTRVVPPAKSGAANTP